MLISALDPLYRETTEYSAKQFLARIYRPTEFGIKTYIMAVSRAPANRLSRPAAKLQATSQPWSVDMEEDIKAEIQANVAKYDARNCTQHLVSQTSGFLRSRNRASNQLIDKDCRSTMATCIPAGLALPEPIGIRA